MQPVLERGSIDKPLTFDVGLMQLSFIPVCSPNTRVRERGRSGGTEARRELGVRERSDLKELIKISSVSVCMLVSVATCVYDM